MDQLKAMMSGAVGDNIYVGASMRKHWNNKTKSAAAEQDEAKKAEYAQNLRAIYKNNMVTYGVPIIRIV